MAALIRIRRDTSNNWASNDPTLAQGELGLDTDTGVIKVGNGSNVWSELYSIGVYNSNDRISKTVDTDTGSLIIDEFGKLYFDRGGTMVFDDTGNLFAGTGNSNFKISLDNHEGDVTEYNFGHDGKITLPAGGLISTGWDSSSSVASIWATDTEAALDWTGNTTIYARNNGVEIYTSSSSDEKFWNFTNSGVLTLPDGGQLGDLEGYTTLFNTDGVALAAGLNNAVVVSPTEGTYIYANAAQYIFDANGTVHLPGNIQLNSSSVILGSTSNTGDDMYIEAIDFSVEDHTVIMVTSHGFMDSDKIYINNIGPGSTQELDDTYCYVLVIDPDNFEIYSDKALTMPIWDAGYTTFVYSGQQPLNGTVARIHDAGSINLSTTMPEVNHDAGSINLNVSDNIWNFGPDGTVTFPMGGRIGATKGGTSFDGGPNGGTTSLSNYYANGNYAACVTAYSNGRLYITTYNDGGDNPSRAWEFNNDGNLVLPANGYILNSDLTVYGGVSGAGGGISISDFGEGFSLTASNKVVTNKLYSTNLTEPAQHYRLELDTNGVVVLPDQSIINGSTLRGVYGTGEANFTGITIGPDSNHREESWVWVDNGGAHIATRYSGDISESKEWHFDNNGILTLPSNNYFETSNANLSIGSQANVYIRSHAQTLEGTKTWMFGQDGNLTFPNNSKFDGQTLTDHATGANYTLKIANGGAAGSKFGIGTGSAAFGIANDALNHAEDGYVPYSVTASRINLTVLGAGSWVFDNTGNLTVPGDIKSTAGTGPVVVQSNDGANSYSWTFGTNGNITFPDSTIQSTAYQRTTGSWNVNVGSATYNFTVPQNNTYTMWVKGTIDNGIIVWNATATVSNANVPVIGQQYAWNYTGGGTPIEITAIPAQFIGTANTIVSSDPSVGTTSNVFNFTINNTSGSAKTVYWGYVTQ
jgi:hypothetical protein